MYLRRTHRPDTTALREIGLDAWLSAHQLADLAAHTDVIDVRAGELLARAGALARQFVAVVDGYVDITAPTGHSHQAGPGTHIGAAELIEARPFTATVTTRTAASLVVIFGPPFRWTVPPAFARSAFAAPLPALVR